MTPEFIEFAKYVAGLAIIAYINIAVVKTEIGTIKDTIKKLDERIWDVAINKNGEHYDEKNKRAA